MADESQSAGEDVGRAALERALQEKDLLLVYQPIHDLRGSIVAAEALLRQRRQSGEIREASIITETAEDAPGPELFVLDSWLVRTAYENAAGWQQRHPNVHLHVNLSPREFMEGPIVERLQSLVGMCGTDPHRVHLEITETSYIERPKETVGVLNTVRDMGFELWLDDFGTRFSSITHLQHFPLSGLKIPGTFVAGLPHDKRCRAICRALVSLSRELGLRIVAEEVESKEQLDVLRDFGCELVQGFFFSRPMPLEAFQRALGAAAQTSTPPERRDRADGRDRASRSS